MLLLVFVIFSTFTVFGALYLVPNNTRTDKYILMKPIETFSALNNTDGS